MSKKIVIDPITRIEGHLKVELHIENGVVVDAKSSGLLFRGLETILKNRDPRDANQITQRVCGVCPQAHASASSMCLDDAFGVRDSIPENARLIRNLIHSSNHIHNSILHFYHLALLDYMDVTNVKTDNPQVGIVLNFLKREEKGPFIPREEGDFRFPVEINQRLLSNYLKALDMRRVAHEMLAVFGGKMPHSCGIVPGGVNTRPDSGRISNFLGRVLEVRDFIKNDYWEDVKTLVKFYPEYLEIGAGCKKFLAFGTFDLEGKGDYLERKRFHPSGITDEKLQWEPLNGKNITESVHSSWYEGKTTYPGDGQTCPKRVKDGYSWIKSPRYNGRAYEVGPLARTLIAYARKSEPVYSLVEARMKEISVDAKKLISVMGRHISRAIEAQLLIEETISWTKAIKETGDYVAAYQLPEESTGAGFSEGARGAVGHWIEIKNRKIQNYQIISPSTWNMSPKDENGNPGPLEQSLIGTKVRNEENPVEVLRIVRSFDPCLACAVQILDRKNLTVKNCILI
jgi:hydrogenase large subunit